MSGEQPPLGPTPADDEPTSVGEGTGSVVPAPVPPGAGVGAGPNPYAEPARPGVHWALVLLGVPIGFVAWVVGSFLVLAATGTLAGSSDNANLWALAVLVPLLIGSVALIVWRRTRRLAQGFVLGAAIGLVVAGGLCIPLVSSF